MDVGDLIHKRKKKYMAQTLEAFERDIQPHLAPEHSGRVQDFKGLVRARMNALAVDAVDLVSLDGQAVNGAAQELRDQISATGR